MKTNNNEPEHWLVRPATVRKLWFGFSSLLVFVVLAQTVIYVKGYFGADGWFGFGAVYGFLSCLLMVLVAKLLGAVLKRSQDYYEDSSRDQEPGQRREKEHTDSV
jgi:Na+/melibiose symporter-like transporter